MEHCPFRLCWEQGGCRALWVRLPDTCPSLHPAAWDPLSALRHLKSTDVFPSRWAGCYVSRRWLSFPQWWDVRRSCFLHAIAQILPGVRVDETASAYSLLGTEVISIPQNPKVLGEQAGCNSPRCYMPDQQSHSVCVCRRTHGVSGHCHGEGQGPSWSFVWDSRQPQKPPAWLRWGKHLQGTHGTTIPQPSCPCPSILPGEGSSCSEPAVLCFCWESHWGRSLRVCGCRLEMLKRAGVPSACLRGRPGFLSPHPPTPGNRSLSEPLHKCSCSQEMELNSKKTHRAPHCQPEAQSDCFLGWMGPWVSKCERAVRSPRWFGAEEPGG